MSDFKLSYEDPGEIIVYLENELVREKDMGYAVQHIQKIFPVSQY